ncbi:hypothetical protein BC834DRAFT_965975 [Gloeopeniophorella convolvens]|nr:hypothetical protein BC834DRAFT_965975 [Gloeopeniophorella convolvens]
MHQGQHTPSSPRFEGGHPSSRQLSRRKRTDAIRPPPLKQDRYVQAHEAREKDKKRRVTTLSKRHRTVKHGEEADSEDDGAAGEIRRLKASIRQYQAECDAALSKLKSSLRTPSIASSPDEDEDEDEDEESTESLIPFPQYLSRVKFGDIRDHLGLMDDKYEPEWRRVKAVVWFTLNRSSLDRSRSFTQQGITKQLDVYDAIEREVPELRRFENSWATSFLAKRVYRRQAAHRRRRNLVIDAFGQPSRPPVTPPRRQISPSGRSEPTSSSDTDTSDSGSTEDSTSTSESDETSSVTWSD